MLDLESQDSLLEEVNLRKYGSADYPSLDIPLLRKAVEVTLTADNWDQSTWITVGTHHACGTAMCLAGFLTVEILGAKPYFEYAPINDDPQPTGWVVHNGDKYLVEDLARQTLGLTRAEADELFNSDNDAKAIQEITDALIEAEEYRLNRISPKLV